jgi:hypothetical protein
VITGYNTDIEYDGVTYHVQTEDKGLKSPVIISLIYHRGTILASKRVSYNDLLEGGLNEDVLAARLQKLHKTICLAVKKGRLEDLRQMAERSAKPEFAETGGVAVGDIAKVTHDQKELAHAFAGPSLPAQDLYDESKELPADLLDEPLIDAVAVFDEAPIIIPHEAVTIVSDLAGMERPGNTRLSIDLIGDSDFLGGQERQVGVMVCRGSDRKVVSGAEVMIKVVGSSFRPLVFHSLTDTNGLSMVTMQIPKFRAGRATMIVRAMNSGEEVEIRRAVRHN